MKLFGWKAGRDDPRPALEFRRTRLFEGMMGDVPQSYIEQVRALYLRNAIAQRAVRIVADGLGEAPLIAAPEILALVQARSGGQALIGTLTTMPGTASAAITDRTNLFEIDLAHAEMALHNADAGALDAGANLALVGDELLQFGTAEQIGPTRWRLGTLLRGRRGTEAAIGTQGLGDRFTLIEADSILSLDLPIAAMGTDVRIMASGPGDVTGPVEVTVPLPGRSIVPPAPVHLRWSESGGDAAVTWVRRSRIGWRWIDRVDAPLGEERERYRVVLTRADGSTQTIETESPALTLSAGQRAGGVTLAVRQVGSLGESPAAYLTIAA